MIIDQLKNLSRYESLHPGFPAAFAFLRELLDKDVSDGRYSMPDADVKEAVYVILGTNRIEPIVAARAEAHKKYIDVQVVLSGEEAMFVPASVLPAVTDPYRADRDCELYTPVPPEICHRLCVGAGSFAIFFDGELHAPSAATGTEPVVVRKAILKVLVSE